eukprot:Nk52_evm27s266 gene=Nk52_evmTU27s266
MRTMRSGFVLSLALFMCVGPLGLRAQARDGADTQVGQDFLTGRARAHTKSGLSNDLPNLENYLAPGDPDAKDYELTDVCVTVNSMAQSNQREEETKFQMVEIKTKIMAQLKRLQDVMSEYEVLTKKTRTYAKIEKKREEIKVEDRKMLNQLEVIPVAIGRVQREADGTLPKLIIPTPKDTVEAKSIQTARYANYYLAHYYNEYNNFWDLYDARAPQDKIDESKRLVFQLEDAYYDELRFAEGGVVAAGIKDSLDIALKTHTEEVVKMQETFNTVTSAKLDDNTLDMEVQRMEARNEPSTTGMQTKSQPNAMEIEASKQTKEAGKEAEKARKEAEKEAEKARKEAEKEAEKARKEAEKEAEKARKEAEKEAKKAQKELKKANKGKGKGKNKWRRSSCEGEWAFNPLHEENAFLRD